MTIDIEIYKQPPSRELYPLCAGKVNIFRDYLDVRLINGKIHSCKTSTGIPLFFPKQVNGRLGIVLTIVY